MFLTALLLASQAAPEVPAVRGDYVEARTASVYAGACHYGSEYTTQGRAAVLGWSFAGGAHDGVDLTGVDLVCVVDADRNLDEPEAKRRAVVYVDAESSPKQREAAQAWLAANHGALIGKVLSVNTARVDVERKGDAFSLSAGKDVALSGTAMPERECCRMSYNVWYEPFVPVQGRLVGNTAEFRVKERALARTWSRPGENAVFFGAF